MTSTGYLRSNRPVIVDLKDLMETRLAFCDFEICQQASVQLSE